MAALRPADHGETSATQYPTPPKSPTPPKTWSSIFEANNSVSEYHPTVVQIKGAATISIPAEITDKPSPLWKNYIQGHFVGPAPHIGKVHAIVNKLWSSMGQNMCMDVEFINGSTALFKIDDDVVKSKVLNRSYWHIAEVPMIVYEWNPENSDRKLDLKAIPLWLDFKGVPGQLYYVKGISYWARKKSFH